MFRFKSAQKIMNFRAKRVAVLLGSIALLASGLVAGVASPASAAPVDASSIRVTRSLADNSVVIRPGEKVSVNLNIQTRTEYKLPENSFVLGDSFTIVPNEISTGLTRISARWEGAFAKYSSGYLNDSNSNNPTAPLLTFALDSADVAAGA